MDGEKTRMSIKEKYVDVLGAAFEFEKESYPDYLIQLDATHNTALVDISKLDFEVEWKPFIIPEFPETQFVSYEKDDFNLELIQRAIEALNPDEYSIASGYDYTHEQEAHLLLLRKGNYAVMISCAIDLEGNGASPITLESIIKKAPTSVLVL